MLMKGDWSPSKPGSRDYRWINETEGGIDCEAADPVFIFLEKGKSVEFELWRQDDNGNRFLIGAFIDRAGAEKMLAELTRNQHKQTYWITVNSAAIQQME
jgi:hypothetical protein